jgi:hypothetical protein
MKSWGALDMSSYLGLAVASSSELARRRRSPNYAV